MLDIISNNLFQVLGVYGILKQADIIRNVSKVKTYLKFGIGRLLLIEIDFILPKLGRGVEQMQNALSQINLSEDRISSLRYVGIDSPISIYAI